MGRKVHPIGFRLNINKPWDGRWYAKGSEYVDQLHQDLEIRKMIHHRPVKRAFPKWKLNASRQGESCCEHGKTGYPDWTEGRNC